MSRLAPALLLLAAACNNPDNLVVGGIGAGPSDRNPTSPPVSFDNINSAISGRATLYDSSGNPTADKRAVVILSDRPNLCSVLQTRRDYFRNPPEGYLAMIFFAPPDRLGTFEPGRPNDQGTGSEIIAVNPPPQPTPFLFQAIDVGYIAITNWADNPGDNTTGSFNLVYNDYLGVTGHPFYGKFKTAVCPTLDGTLLP